MVPTRGREREKLSVRDLEREKEIKQMGRKREKNKWAEKERERN